MKTAQRRTIRRFLTTAALVLAPAVGLAGPASATTTAVTFDCQGNAPTGAQTFTMSQSVDASAPATAAPGSAVTVVVTPAPNTVPASVNGNNIKQVQDMSLKIPVPANSTFVSMQLSGGSNLGANPPTWSVSGNIITVHLDGPIAGGSTFQLPAMTMQLTAGQSGTIQSTVYGSSYSDPGLTFTAVVSSIIGDVNVPTACYPNPAPVFTTTTIG